MPATILNSQRNIVVRDVRPGPLDALGSHETDAKEDATSKLSDADEMLLQRKQGLVKK